MNTKFSVSEKAWKKGGSKMFVEVGKTVSVLDLLRGVVVQSGNDATIVLAEGLAGSEDAFAVRLNATAKELGLKDSQFKNASGWPDPNHYSTARDLAHLGAAVIRDTPDIYKYYAEEEFTHNDIKQPNRNPLLYRGIGADGIKTGHTEAGGYGLIGSGVRNGRRVIVVINGLKDEAARAQESSKLLEWGLVNFKTQNLHKAGDDIAQAPVDLGKAKAVNAYTKTDLKFTVPVSNDAALSVTPIFKSDLIAPIAKDDDVGVLRIEIAGQPPYDAPLYAHEDVAALGFIAKTFVKIKRFIGGFIVGKTNAVINSALNQDNVNKSNANTNKVGAK